MNGTSVCVFTLFAAAGVLAPPLRAQAVISTRAGVVHFFEGEVFLAGQTLEPRLAKFASIPEGAELRTGQGRAEVLLTPGVFLRIGQNSAVRMIASALTDTRVGLIAGSAIVDSEEPAAGTSVTVIYRQWTVRQPQKGSYRIDCDPPRLRVMEGEAVVSAGSEAPLTVAAGMELPFAQVLVPEPANARTNDALSDWAQGRAQSISADNAIAAGIQDPATQSDPDFAADGFTYYPLLGLSSPVSGPSDPYAGLSSYPSGLYGTAVLSQPGFYSLYLPGYTFRPLLLGVPVFGLSHSSLPPLRIGVSAPPGIGISRLPGIGVGRLPTTERPISRPLPVRPAPHAVPHVGGRR